LLIIPGLVALAAAISIWLANRIGPTPGTSADLIAGIGALGARFGLPPIVAPILFAVLILLSLAMIGVLISSLVSELNAEAGPVVVGAPAPAAKPASAEKEEEASEDVFAGAPAPAAEAQSDAVFVSYARANSGLVMPVIDGAKSQGKHFW